MSIHSKNYILTVLALVLCVVVGLFLYSEYANKPAVPTSPISYDSTADVAVPVSELEGSSSASVDKTSDQLDKSLPIPAHQLKKLLEEAPQTTELDEKIEQVNQAIAELEKQLPEGAQAPTGPQGTPEANADLEKRLNHLREHLQKNP